MLLGIDHGNYAIKTTSFEFVSGLAEHTVKPPMTDEILEYHGKYWTLSGRQQAFVSLFCPYFPLLKRWKREGTMGRWKRFSLP